MWWPSQATWLIEAPWNRNLKLCWTLREQLELVWKIDFLACTKTAFPDLWPKASKAQSSCQVHVLWAFDCFETTENCFFIQYSHQYQRNSMKAIAWGVCWITPKISMVECQLFKRQQKFKRSNCQWPKWQQKQNDTKSELNERSPDHTYKADKKKLLCFKILGANAYDLYIIEKKVNNVANNFRSSFRSWS